MASSRLSPELLDLLTKATAKDPNDRLSPSEFLHHDVFNCDISDSEDFSIKYQPTMMMYPRH